MKKWLAILAVAALPVVGCGPTAAQVEARSAVKAYQLGNYDRAIRKLEPLAEEPDGDYALNNLRLGMAGLAAGDLDVAERGFYAAYEVMNAGRVNKGGREAAAVWLSEDFRIWKGEPYERAIANLHLGIVYYLRGDLENARGAFENALFKLRDYEDADAENFEEVESTFAAGLILLGRTWLELGRDDLAEQQFALVRERVPELAPLADAGLHRRTNTLAVVGVGRGPVKVEDGPHLAFASPLRDEPPLPPVALEADGEPLGTWRGPAYDALAMARQRRWQKIDTIRATKSVAGDGLLLGGAVVLGEAENRDNAAVGAGMILTGLLLKATSRPDLRVWETAPRGVILIPLDLPPGEHEIVARTPGGLVDARLVRVEAGGTAGVYLLPTRPAYDSPYRPSEGYLRPPPTLLD